MSIVKLSKIVNSRKVAMKRFQTERWKKIGRTACVQCGSIKIWKHRKLKNGLQKYQCQDCRHVFSDQSTTHLRWNKVKIEKVAIVLELANYKNTVTDLAKQAELSSKTAYKLRQLIRKVKAKLWLQMPKPMLSGIVEADETKISGKWLWGAIDRNNPSNVKLEFIPNRSEFVIMSKVWKHIEENSTVMTDQLPSYNLPRNYYQHFSVNHSKSFVHPECKIIHTNTMEGAWGNIKRILDRFHNHVELHNILDYIYDDQYSKFHRKSKLPVFFPLYCDKP